ncbi:hypothetical protein [Micromonospora parathelypteridis]|uniref:Integral membrane protein n=1 Tax=Micromonospora parathelypteridis TaxID=1839617 RepID=A0A840VFI0_9ACTN|nr:hypothetical protein [Micromonospora parathelypteridis]MBB5475592.1 hypothetical protein [Micromonospora parathelypteridis]GGO27499.1 hypothetical protein GCM10011576_52260 [Micromonospora parathelypteridis]
MADVSPTGTTTSGGIVELRVHGVSGSGADQVLNRPYVHQVAGDRSGGFYRPRPGYPDSTGTGGVTLEAYRWSDLPSGTAVRTLSLVFLLPFMLCNVALWMHPAIHGWKNVVVALCRVLALTLTMLYVLSIVGVAVDLIAWRCMGTPACMGGRSWLSWLSGRPIGLRLGVLALVPVAAIGLVWWLSTRLSHSFDAFRTREPAASKHRLSAVGQWDGAPLVGRLRSVHVAAAFATLDGSLLAARSSQHRSPTMVVLLAATGGLLLTCLVLVAAVRSIDRTDPTPGMDAFFRGLRTIACGVTILVIVHVVISPAPWSESRALPGYGAIVAWLFVSQTVLVVILAALVIWRRGGRHPDGGGRPAPLRALGAPVLVTIAAGLAVAFSAELVYRTADVLDRDGTTADGLVTSPPLAYKWAIFGFFLAVLSALLAAGVVTLLTRGRRWRAARAIVAADFPHAPPEAAERLRQVEQAVARARFTERLEPLTVVYAGLAALGLATSALGLFHILPGDVLQQYVGLPENFVNFFIGTGSYVIAALLLGLVIGGLFAYRTVGFRRYVGVLWDLGTFWPRAAHPFAPPCYAERAVPELAKRISYLVEQGHGVLLTGHSHGSVLLAATVLQLPARITDRCALLTHGSPLRRLYARLFPASVNVSALEEIGERVGWRWVNLWRDTDPIGGWIFAPHRDGDNETPAGPAAAVDRRLTDPLDVVPPPSDSVPPPIMAHWPSESQEAFAEAARDLIARLRAGRPGTG